ncbi:MAG TPA: TonB family protein [Campylobacterales bacterium]|nr:TonB family protein [Campylobacterales bacterium]
MRVLQAFIVSLLIYTLLIWLFVAQFPTFKKPFSSKHEHVVKIDIREIPLNPPTPTKPLAPQSVPKVKPVQKKSVKEERVKKETKPVEKPIPKKTEVKKVEKKKVEVKKPESKKVEMNKNEIKKSETKKKTEQRVERPKVLTKKTESLQKFEEEMVYIPDAMLMPSSSSQQETVQKTAQKEADDLGSFFTSPASTTSTQAYPSNKVQQLYGTEYHQFTATQKKFIEDNLDTIQQITQRTLSQRGYPRGAGETGQEGTNIVSFNLHPNGDISNLRLKSGTGYRALDENSVTLIRVAYKDYPYPSTTTKIVFHVHYSIYGY